MSEYRVDVKVRNNIILSRLKMHGYDSIGTFQMAHNIHGLHDIVNMTSSPIQKDGKWRNNIIKTAEILQCSPEDLFTESQLHTILKTNKKSIEVNEAEMKFMLSYKPEKSLEDQAQSDQMRKLIDGALETLTPREQRVLKLRYGIEGEEYYLNEIGEKIGVTGARVRQIHEKAMRKLRHPERTNKLRELADE